MNNLKNKSELVKNRKKNYLERFLKLPIYSYTKPNDNHIFLSPKPTDVYDLFHGNATNIKNTINGRTRVIHADEVFIDQSTLQSYMILAIQDLYENYIKPLEEDNKRIYTLLNELGDEIKESHENIQMAVQLAKKKNDDRFEVLTKNLEKIAQHINDLKRK